MNVDVRTPITTTTDDASKHPATYEIGAPVHCDDGECGELSRVIVDPIKRAVTHLVVEPARRHSLARLVPVTLLDTAGGPLRLHCTIAMFHALQYVEETEFVPGEDRWTSSSYPGLSAYPGSMVFPGVGAMMWPYFRQAPTTIEHERVPVGEIELRRGDVIHATDGQIGKIRGLVVDADDHHVTHVLVHEGHLWGAKDVAIPISAVTAIRGDGVQVSQSKSEIAELPGITLEPTVGT